jgi:hypothetical protein
MPKRLLALLFSVPLAASGVAGVALHICQSMGGIAAGDCDCEMQTAHAGHGQHATHRHQVPGPKLQGHPCCTVTLTEASPAVATHEASTVRVDDAPVAFIGLRESSQPKSRLACNLDLLRERAPPNIHGPPLFVRHCSFLN